MSEACSLLPAAALQMTHLANQTRRDLSSCVPWLNFALSPPLSSAAFLENTKAIVVVILSSLALCTLVAIAVYLYKRQWTSEQRAFESARYSRTSSNPSESAEKNILVSDMEMNEQQD